MASLADAKRLASLNMCMRARSEPATLAIPAPESPPSKQDRALIKKLFGVKTCPISNDQWNSIVVGRIYATCSSELYNMWRVFSAYTVTPGDSCGKALDDPSKFLERTQQALSHFKKLVSGITGRSENKTESKMVLDQYDKAVVYMHYINTLFGLSPVLPTGGCVSTLPCSVDIGHDSGAHVWKYSEPTLTEANQGIHRFALRLRFLSLGYKVVVGDEAYVNIWLVCWKFAEQHRSTDSCYESYKKTVLCLTRNSPFVQRDSSMTKWAFDFSQGCLKLTLLLRRLRSYATFQARVARLSDTPLLHNYITGLNERECTLERVDLYPFTGYIIGGYFYLNIAHSKILYGVPTGLIKELIENMARLASLTQHKAWETESVSCYKMYKTVYMPMLRSYGTVASVYFNVLSVQLRTANSNESWAADAAEKCKESAEYESEHIKGYSAKHMKNLEMKIKEATAAGIAEITSEFFSHIVSDNDLRLALSLEAAALIGATCPCIPMLEYINIKTLRSLKTGVQTVPSGALAHEKMSDEGQVLEFRNLAAVGGSVHNLVRVREPAVKVGVSQIALKELYLKGLVSGEITLNMCPMPTEQDLSDVDPQLAMKVRQLISAQKNISKEKK